MIDSASPTRRGEYAVRGDYHRAAATDWSYYPTYVAKLRLVRRYLDALPAHAHVLDAGCGEGVLVEEYRSRLAIEGLDLNYESVNVRAGSLLSLPYGAHHFEYALCLDVLEHLPHADQPRALTELWRVLAPGGELLLSVPNLAHLQSRLHFLLRGELMRTASEQKHPGDRPVREYLQLARAVGFELIEQRGIFPTVPWVTAAIRRRPAALLGLHHWLTRLLPIPGWCFLNVLRLRKPSGG